MANYPFILVFRWFIWMIWPLCQGCGRRRSNRQLLDLCYAAAVQVKLLYRNHDWVRETQCRQQAWAWMGMGSISQLVRRVCRPRALLVVVVVVFIYPTRATNRPLSRSPDFSTAPKIICGRGTCLIPTPTIAILVYQIHSQAWDRRC